MSVTLQFFNGVDGLGVQILMRAGHAGLVFDLGTPFDPLAGPFNGFVRPRPGHEARDYMRMGWAPPVHGLFHDVPKLPQHAVGHDLDELAVFVSHHDLDHSALVPYLHPDIPLYAHPETIRSFLAGGWRHPLYRPVHPGKHFQVGCMSFQLLEVDHGPQGAAGFIATVGEMRIGYSGDWRWHGDRPDLTEAFIEACRAPRLDVLLVEANRAGGWYGAPPGQERRANDLPMLVSSFLESSSSLVLHAFDPRNHRGLRAMQAWFLAANRTLVVQPGTAALLRAYEETHINGADAEIDRPLPVSSLAEPEVWQAVVANPSAFVVESHLDALPTLAELLEAIDDQHGPRQASTPLLHAGGSPLGPFEASWGTFETWMERLGVTFVPVGVNGHAPEADLHRFVQAIDPHVVIPVHTRDPAAAVPSGVRAHLPTQGEVIRIGPGGAVHVVHPSIGGS